MIPPIYPRIRHRAANSRNASVLVFEILMNWVTLRCVERDPRNSTRAASYFRTPSPSGRLLIPSLKSPAIYSGKPLFRRAFAGNRTPQPCVLNPQPSLSGSASEHQVEHKGIGRCDTGLVFCWLQAQWPWRAAATQSQNKGSWAQGPGLRQPSCWMAPPSQGRSWALQATWFTARPTPESATDALGGCGFAAPDGPTVGCGDDAAPLTVLKCPRSALKTDTRGKADDTSFQTGAGRCLGHDIGRGSVRAARSRRLQPGASQHVGADRRGTYFLGRRATVKPARFCKERFQQARWRAACFGMCASYLTPTSPDTQENDARPVWQAGRGHQALGEQRRVQ